MDILSSNFIAGDQILIDQIVREVKSQGIFDQFRKECISDVDTKPAYQNLRQRVESSVHGFLTKQTWNPDMNKNQVREMLRKNINESGFLETGVERIVDQVVNPKISSVFLPKVEDIVYKFLGIEKPMRIKNEEESVAKSNTFTDLLPKDLEAISPEMHCEKGNIVKEETSVVNMEEDESPSFEAINDNVKVLQEETSVDSQFSLLSETVNQDSEYSQKQDSLMSLNSSESRMSLSTSEITSKVEHDDVFLSQKSSDSNSKSDMVIDLKMEVDTEEQNDLGAPPIIEQAIQSEIKPDVNSEDFNLKSREQDKKRERHHSSSDKSKSSRSDKDKERSRSDKHKKEEKESSKEQKPEKYRIPKLSDKIKAEKEAKSKDKEKSREKSDIKSEKVKKYDKDKKSSKHSSERDKSKSDSKSKKDSKSDRRDKEKDEKRDKEKDEKRDKEKDEKRDKKDSSRSDKSKESRKSSSSSSRKRESSSSKDKYKEKDRESSSSKKSEEEKKKNGHSSSSKKESSRSKKDDEKTKSSHKKDDKNEEDDKKRKRSAKDDHYDSKDKKNGRRSSDRDSDGPSNSKRLPTTPQKNSEKYSCQKSNQESSCSNMGSSAGDSGNSEKNESKSGENEALLQEMQKIKLPKFASNLQEAMKIMKIRKQLKKMESIDNVNLDSLEMKKILQDIAELSKENKKGNKEKVQKTNKICEKGSEVDNSEKVNSRPISLDITDFISSSNISMAKWNALEAKFMEQMGQIDYNSYESPYLDDEESDTDHNKWEGGNEICDRVHQENVSGEVKKETSNDPLEKEQKQIVQESYTKVEEDSAGIIEEIVGETYTNVEEETADIVEEIVGNMEDEEIIEEKIIENTQEMEESRMVTLENEKIEDKEIVEIVQDIEETEKVRIENSKFIEEEINGNVQDNMETEVVMMEDEKMIEAKILENIQDTEENERVNTEDDRKIEAEIIGAVRDVEEIATIKNIVNSTPIFEQQDQQKDENYPQKLENSKSDVLSHSGEDCDDSVSTASNLDHFKKKAYVYMQKHALTEEIIGLKMNGHCDTLKAKDGIKIDNEKENIILNIITDVEEVEEGTLINESKTKLKSNTVIRESTSLKNTDSQIDNLQNEKAVTKEVNRPTRHSRSLRKRQSLCQNDNKEEGPNDEEECCKGFQPEGKDSWARLQNLIENIQKDMANCMEHFRESDIVGDLKQTPRARKRKTQEVRFQISNNNVETLAPKRLRTKNNSPGPPVYKSEIVPKRNAHEETTDISVETKFSLPLSPAESEPSAEKKVTGGVKSKKKAIHTIVSKPEIIRENSPKMKRPRAITNKSVTTQRYSNEDLYKPRILLRRSAKGARDS